MALNKENPVLLASRNPTSADSLIHSFTILSHRGGHATVMSTLPLRLIMDFKKQQNVSTSLHISNLSFSLLLWEALACVASMLVLPCSFWSLSSLF